MACATPRTWLFACWKPGAISPYLLKKCSPCPMALTRSVLTPHELHWRTGWAGSPGNRYGPGSPDTHPDRYAVPRSVVTAYWKSTEEAVPIMPRLSEGRALSPLKIHPFPSGFVWLTPAHPVGISSTKIGSSPLEHPRLDCLPGDHGLHSRATYLYRNSRLDRRGRRMDHRARQGGFRPAR